jgi:threonine dehydrogenase-like Zn-dependent dehydrogenase
MIAMTLALTGCELSVLARHANQRKLLEARRITVISEADLPEKSMDIVVEASGSEAGFPIARRAVRARGTIVLKSTYHGRIQVDLSSIVVDEIHLVGSRCGPFPPALRLLENGQVDPLPMVEMEYPLSKGLEAFEYAARPGVLKVLLQPE